MRLFTAMRNGFAAFWSTLNPTSSALTGPDRSSYGELGERLARYALYWRLYHNQAYRTHSWGDGRYSRGFDLKKAFGLSQEVAGVYSQLYRLVQIHAMNIFGGSLDPDAGDGKQRKSAIPILFKDDQIGRQLRPMLAQIFLWSNLETNKNLLPFYGSLTGDAPLLVADRPRRQKVALCPFDPSELEDKTNDEEGNVTSFVRTRTVEDPTVDPEPIGTLEFRRMSCRRTDKYVKEDDGVHLYTFRDESPFDWEDLFWNGYSVGRRIEEGTYVLPYDFVPLVHVQHTDLGLGWGQSELAIAIVKSVYVDDGGTAALLQGRKAIEAILAIPGADERTLRAVISQIRGDSEPDVNTGATRYRRDSPDTVPIIGVPEGSIPSYIAPNLDIGTFSAHVDKLLESHIGDFPELAYDKIRLLPNVSGETLKEVQKPARTKLEAKRAPYRDGLLRSFKMALTIAGVRGYPGFSGIDLNSYDRGSLNFSIGNTPVYEVTRAEELAETLAVGQAITALMANGTGFTFEAACRQVGLDEVTIAEAVKQRQLETDQKQQKALQGLTQALNTTPAALPGVGTGG